MADLTKLDLVRLASDGANWVSYKDRLDVTLRMRRWQEHLIEDAVTQAYEDRGPVNNIEPGMRWEDDDQAVKHIIMNSIPDELFIRIKSGVNAKAWWDSLKTICEGRSRSLLIDLGRRLQNTYCGDNDNVRAHFAKLANIREQLASMGQSIADQQYANILLASLPPCYEMRVCAITTNADETGGDIDITRMMKLISDDYDKRMLGRSNNNSEDQAFAASGQKKDRREIECFNCKKKGHIKAECWAKGGGKEGQAPKRRKPQDKNKSGNTVATATDKTEDLESWAAIISDDDLLEEDPSSSESWATNSDADNEDVESWATIEDISDDDEEFASSEEMPEEVTNTSQVIGGSKVELYDSGASRHISPFRDQFVTYRAISPRAITAADKRLFYAIGTGDMRIEVPNGEKTTPILLRDALHAPDIGLTVVSVGRIANTGNSVSFEGETCKIKNQKGNTIGKIPASANGLYKVEHDYVGAVTEQTDILTLHKRLGHISADAIRALVLNDAVTGLQLINPSSSFTCASCEYAKTTRKPINKERTSTPARTFGEEIHSDLWGPSPIMTIGGRKYYVSFTDDYTRYTSLDLLKYKDETLAAYKAFAAWVKNQHGADIKRLRSDRGGEYTSKDFTKFLQEQGTERRLTTHDTPQHNGVAEALNRRLFERVRAILHHSELPKSLWGEAVMFAVWLKNRTSTRALGNNTTPYEKLYGKKPNLAGVPEWGQRVWVHYDKGSKLDARAVECRWVGYDRDSTHAHRVYWPDKHRVSVERNIKFVSTTVTIYSPSPSGSLVTSPPRPPPSPPSTPPPTRTTSPMSTPPKQPPVATESGEEEMPEREDEEEEVRQQIFTSPPVSRPTIASQLKGKSPARPKKPKTTGEPVRRSQRIAEQAEKQGASGEGLTSQKPPMPGGLTTLHGAHLDCEEHEEALFAEIKEELEEEKLEGLQINEQCLVATVVQETQDDPKTLQEASSREDWPLWKEAMDKELATLEEAGTWVTVPRPNGKNVVGSKWVFHIKRNADGSVNKYKARLVARGFTQIFGVDYYNTFSPVAKLASFRSVLALAARFDWEIKSFDFNGAYLNGELDEDEEIYMQAPPGYEGQGEHQVKRLKKSLYGLKQAGRKWYDALSRALADLGFRTSQADPGVFYMRYKGHILILVVHVDDCIFTGSSSCLLEEYKAQFHARYTLTDLGPVNWLLGIKITQDRSTRSISLSQSTYIDSILARFALEDVKAQATPMVPGAVFSRGDSPSSPSDMDRMRKVPYREAIGSLMYASVATRPDISFAVSMLSQFLDNPGDAHWIGVKRIFRYLAGTQDVELTYGAERHDLVGYTDADGATQEHRRAISGHAFLIDGGAVSWSSRKQELVTLSTAEAEYVAATHAAKEALWLRKLVRELFPSFTAPTPLYCDNQAAIRLIEDDNYHARTKHIDVRYHFIRHTVQSGALDMIYCPTEEMVADMLTKALPKWKTFFHNSTLGLQLRHA